MYISVFKMPPRKAMSVFRLLVLIGSFMTHSISLGTL